MSEGKRIAILGSGPTGLEAALAAVDAGLPFTIYEAGPAVASSMRSWGHVRLFSPWELDVSPRMRRHLEGAGHAVPDGGGCPTGGELVEQVLAPVAALPAVAPHLVLGTRVRSIGRQGLLKHQAIGSPERATKPLRLLLDGPEGEHVATADLVFDCTGTYDQPNALGDGGIPALGEASIGSNGIVRHIPDFAAEADAWVGKTILVVGAGHSAQTAVRDLATLVHKVPGTVHKVPGTVHKVPGTHIIWALRSENPRFEPIADDALPERAALVAAAGALASGQAAAIEPRTGVTVDALRQNGERIDVDLRDSTGAVETITVDRVLSLVGYVGDASMYRQLQVHECYATSGPMKLAAALLGESSTDCLAQASHGADALKNPEPGFFILGSKSYGRNTSFLMRVGWEQVEEVFGLIAAERAVA